MKRKGSRNERNKRLGKNNLEGYKGEVGQETNQQPDPKKCTTKIVSTHCT